MEFNVKGSPFVEQDEPGAWDFAKNVQAPNCVSGSQKSNIIYILDSFLKTAASITAAQNTRQF